MLYSNSKAEASIEHLEWAVLQVLMGLPLSTVAQQCDIQSTLLEAGVEIYRLAGHQALKGFSGSHWYYWRIPLAMTIPWDQWGASEDPLIVDIGALCHQLVSEGSASCWWFLRKGDAAPHLRLRLFGESPALLQKVIPRVEELLRQMEQTGRIQHWTTPIYEPEVNVFGGAQGIDLAHVLFYHDSEALYQWLACEKLDFMETRDAKASNRRTAASLLVLRQLQRGAQLDIFEQHDVWFRVSQLRPWTTTATPAQRQKNAAIIAGLLELPKEQLPVLFGEAFYPLVLHWMQRFEEMGQALARLNREGQLQRGLRQVLASHVIFHWNRFGFRPALQIELAQLIESVLAQY